MQAQRLPGKTVIWAAGVAASKLGRALAAGTGATLDRATLKGTRLGAAELSGVRARGAFFGEAIFEVTRLVKASLRYATFSRATLDRVDLSGADLRETLWIEARATNTLFVSARMNYSDLSHADVRGSDFTDAGLLLANLHNLHDDGARGFGANRLMARGTDLDRLEAEAWTPPPPATRTS